MDVIIIGAGVGGMTLGLSAPSAASQCFHCERSSRPVVCRVSAARVKLTLRRMRKAACDERKVLERTVGWRVGAN